MPTDLTGTPTTLGIGTYNVTVDAPSGLGFNAAMGQIDTLIGARALLASPAFTGTPTAPTPSTGDNSTKIATTAWVKNQTYVTSVAGKTGDVTLDFTDVSGGVYTFTDSFGFGGDTITPDLANGNFQIVNVTQTGGAPETLTINVPDNPPASDQSGIFTFGVKTNGASVPFNIDFSGYKSNGYTLPTASGVSGNTKNATFLWDGTVWMCIGTGSYSGGNG